jgi:nucleoside-diphosphate-sugar epimerase
MVRRLDELDWICAEFAMSRKTALITGATGVIGPAVVWALKNAGYRTRIFSRCKPNQGLLPSDAELFLGDITDPVTIEPAMQNVTLVVHLAGLLHIIAPSESLRESYRRINVEGTANVVAAATRAGTERVVFSSTIAVYGDSANKVLTEESALNPGTLYAETKLDAEGIVLSARNSDGKPLGTVLRLAAVYGARLKGNYRRLVSSLAHKRFIPIGAGSNRRTLIYFKDVATAVVLVAGEQAAAGKVYNVTDGQVHTLDEIISTICESLGRKPPRISIPLGAARLAAATLEDSARIVGVKSSIGRETINKYAEDIAVDGTRIQSELGFDPQFDLRSGWKETVEEMRRDGQLRT